MVGTSWSSQNTVFFLLYLKLRVEKDYTQEDIPRYTNIYELYIIIYNLRKTKAYTLFSNKEQIFVFTTKTVQHPKTRKED
jgi:hypothetical protein